MNENNIFKKIINKEVDSMIIYEDKNFIAILDIFPKQKGHTLLIPKSNNENFLLEDENIKSKINDILIFLSNKLIKNLNASGIKITTNIGKSAGQEIMHTHFHLIPYYDHNEKNINNIEILNQITKN